MSITVRPTSPCISAVDAQTVDEGLRVIARKGATSIAQVLLQQQAPTRVCNVAAQLPSVGNNAYDLLEELRSAGVVARSGDHTAVSFALTDRGRALPPVHRALSEWSQRHFPLGPMTPAERIEDAARRLHPRRSTAVIQVLDAYGSRPMVDLAALVGMRAGYLHRRLATLHKDGLVTREAHRGAHYRLTAAGRALAPVYAAVERWYAHDAHGDGREPGR
ncbi:hypothetical protein C3486_02150 [Streptomyces sp. Ru73]|uniref:winged helix-turn-helix transcriptional regulator n=1 Tax=Streptomyces sp. Ru73 TaxID=2080748 RepID=UPI000CDDE084|nr:winged helix-turn-helix transcriptional regulator [Streptomyces sp. Ru73]POX43045.1 hypothetical protein C3486_02150 [Streptomyces sp. Ru73]